jgi:hypothetical protein
MPPPDASAWQTFYGTLPLILVISGAFLRSQLVLKDILERLGRIEAYMIKVEKRLVQLETRAGIIYHE